MKNEKNIWKKYGKLYIIKMFLVNFKKGEKDMSVTYVGPSDDGSVDPNEQVTSAIRENLLELSSVDSDGAVQKSKAIAPKVFAILSAVALLASVGVIIPASLIAAKVIPVPTKKMAVALSSSLFSVGGLLAIGSFATGIVTGVIGCRGQKMDPEFGLDEDDDEGIGESTEIKQVNGTFEKIPEVTDAQTSDPDVDGACDD